MRWKCETWKCRTGKCGTNLQGVENARLENVAQKCRTGKCGTKLQRVENAGMEKAGKENYDPGYWCWSCTHESWHEPPPLQEKEQPTQRRPNKSVHNLAMTTARTHAFSFYAPSATSLDRMHALCPEDCSAESDVDDDDNQEEEVSVDSGDDQPSADVGSQDLYEVCMIAQRDTWQAQQVPCGLQRFCGSCITKIGEEGRGCPMCRAPIIMILGLLCFCSRITVRPILCTFQKCVLVTFVYPMLGLFATSQCSSHYAYVDLSISAYL